jgi:hypothetical protein
MYLLPDLWEDEPSKEKKMDSNLLLIDPLRDERWDDFAKSHPSGSIYHSSFWFGILKQTYSFTPFYYSLTDGNNKLIGIIPLFLVKSFLTGNRMVSLPFSDFCGPIFLKVEDKEKCINKIIQMYRSQVKYFEIRSAEISNSNLTSHNYYKLHRLDLSDDPKEIMKMVDKKTIQYSIRKAIREGIKIKEENTLKGIKEFYRLNILTRKKHGVPPQPFKFFKNILDLLILKKMGSILLATYEGKYIAAGIFLNFKDTVYYKYNASDPAYLSKTTPNHLLTWHAIEHACLNGYRFLDFGRTSPDNKGLIRYKEMWGAYPMDLPYYYYPKVMGVTSKEEISLSYYFFTSLWKFLPNSIVEKFGPIFYRHIS